MLKMGESKKEATATAGSRSSTARTVSSRRKELGNRSSLGFNSRASPRNIEGKERDSENEEERVDYSLSNSDLPSSSLLSSIRAVVDSQGDDDNDGNGHNELKEDDEENDRDFGIDKETYGFLFSDHQEEDPVVEASNSVATLDVKDVDIPLPNQKKELLPKSGDYKAPLSLVMEFLKNITDGDLKHAKKLSTRILEFEPQNKLINEYRKALDVIDTDDDNDDDGDNDNEDNEEEDDSSEESSEENEDDDDDDDDDEDDDDEEEDEEEDVRNYDRVHYPSSSFLGGGGGEGEEWKSEAKESIDGSSGVRKTTGSNSSNITSSNCSNHGLSREFKEEGKYQ